MGSPSTTIKNFVSFACEFVGIENIVHSKEKISILTKDNGDFCNERTTSVCRIIAVNYDQNMMNMRNLYETIKLGVLLAFADKLVN